MAHCKLYEKAKRINSIDFYLYKKVEQFVRLFSFLNPNYVIELCDEGFKYNKIRHFRDFSIAPLW